MKMRSELFLKSIPSSNVAGMEILKREL